MEKLLTELAWESGLVRFIQKQKERERGYSGRANCKPTSYFAVYRFLSVQVISVSRYI